MVKTRDWVERVNVILKQKEVKTLLYAPDPEIGQALENAWSHASDTVTDLIAYRQEIEHCKDEIFAMDAGVWHLVSGVR